MEPPGTSAPASLFEQIAEEHGVPTAFVSGALGRNRAGVEFAINLPFVLLYCFASVLLSRWFWHRYPPAQEAWAPVTIMAVFISLAMAASSTMLGELWSWSIESYRIGNQHMSYRAQRLLWERLRVELAVAAMITFWLVLVGFGRRANRKVTATAT
jgi:hypothetical protein